MGSKEYVIPTGYEHSNRPAAASRAEETLGAVLVASLPAVPLKDRTDNGA